MRTVATLGWRREGTAVNAAGEQNTADYEKSSSE